MVRVEILGTTKELQDITINDGTLLRRPLLLITNALDLVRMHDPPAETVQHAIVNHDNKFYFTLTALEKFNGKPKMPCDWLPCSDCDLGVLSIVHPLEPRYSGKRLSDWADILALSWTNILMRKRPRPRKPITTTPRVPFTTTWVREHCLTLSNGVGRRIMHLRRTPLIGFAGKNFCRGLN